MERQAYFEFVPKYNRQTKLSNNSSKVPNTRGYIDQNSATVCQYVNRDNFKLNAVYDVKIDTVNTLKITTKTNFTLLTVMSLLAVHWQRCLLRNKQERLFTTNSDKAALSASVLF
jgi:hypothetical protein